MTIDELLSAPASPDNAEALVRWVADLRGRIVRGDMMIGLLSVAEVEKAPLALRKAAESGLATAWFQLAAWLAAPPRGRTNPREALAVLRAAIERDVPGG